jgi:hypothetical protein
MEMTMLKQMLIAAIGAIAFATPLPAQEAPPTTQVMVLGSYHFSNPGLDAVNLEADDVLSERRQREIQILAETLAEWRPTKIVVERVVPAPTFLDSRYADYEKSLATLRGEDVQIGYRVAKMLDHPAVYGFDEQPQGDEPDYFPMGPLMEFAKENDQQNVVAGLMAIVEAKMAEEQAAMEGRSIAANLLMHNDPEVLTSMHDRLYYGLIEIGDGEDQPGAVLNAMWYMRNAKMFAKMDMVAEPGDRVLMIVGSGHATWMRHFAQRTPRYSLVESYPYLELADARSADTE